MSIARMGYTMRGMTNTPTTATGPDYCPTCGKRITDDDMTGFESGSGQRYCVEHSPDGCTCAWSDTRACNLHDAELSDAERIDYLADDYPSLAAHVALNPSPVVGSGRYTTWLDNTRGYCPRCEAVTAGRILRERAGGAFYFHCSGCCARHPMVTPATMLGGLCNVQQTAGVTAPCDRLIGHGGRHSWELAR